MDLVEHLEQGRLLPPRYYRSRIDRDDDGLLEEHGIKHLHLGDPHSDVLVFLIEYQDRITLLEVNDHKHFRTTPAGALLNGLHRAYVEKEERESLEKRRAEIERRKGYLRMSLRPRRKR